MTRAVALPGIAQAVAATRDAVDVVLRQRAVQTGAARLAEQSVVAGVRASAIIEGGDAEQAATTDPSVEVTDPLVLGAQRATLEVVELAARWESAPLQVLARLHLLAAADLAPADSLGRPQDPTAARRLTAMISEIGRSAGIGSSVPAMVVAAVVHAEAAQAFAPAGGLVGRAAERVVLRARGVDRTGVLVPEEGHLAEVDGYERDRARLTTGTDQAVAIWVERCCRAYTKAADVTASAL